MCVGGENEGLNTWKPQAVSPKASNRSANLFLASSAPYWGINLPLQAKTLHPRPPSLHLEHECGEIPECPSGHPSPSFPEFMLGTIFGFTISLTRTQPLKDNNSVAIAHAGGIARILHEIRLKMRFVSGLRRSLGPGCWP